MIGKVIWQKLVLLWEIWARRQELGRVRELRVVDGNVWVIRDRRAGITEGKPMGKCQGVGDEQTSLIVGLDIGTTKICAVVGKLFDPDQLKMTESDKIEILGIDFAHPQDYAMVLWLT